MSSCLSFHLSWSPILYTLACPGRDYLFSVSYLFRFSVCWHGRVIFAFTLQLVTGCCTKRHYSECHCTERQFSEDTSHSVTHSMAGNFWSNCKRLVAPAIQTTRHSHLMTILICHRPKIDGQEVCQNVLYAMLVQFWGSVCWHPIFPLYGPQYILKKFCPSQCT